MSTGARRWGRRVVDTYVDAFRGLPRPIWSLSVVLLINRAGSMVMVFLALYLTQELGWTLTLAGTIVALHGLGAVVGSLLGGWLTDRFDTHRVMVGSLTLSGLGYLLLELPRTPLSLGALVLLASTASEGFRPANLSALADLAPAGLEARAMALARLAINLGMAIGPTLGGFLSVYGYRWLFRIDGFTCLLAAAALAWLFRPSERRALVDREIPDGRSGPAGPAPEALAPAATEARAAPLPDRRQPLHDRAFLAFLALSVINVAIFFQAFSTFPVDLESQHGIAETHFGLLMSTNAVLILIFEMVLVKSLEHLPPLRLVAAGALITGVGFSLLEIGRGWPVALLSITVWTVGEMLISPFAVSWVSQRTGPGNRGKYMGLYTTSWGLGFGLGPFLGARVYDRWGSAALWLGIGGLALVSAVGFELLHRRETLRDRERRRREQDPLSL